MSSIVLHEFADAPSCLQQLAADLASQLQRVLEKQAEAQLLLPGGRSPQALLPLLAAQSLPWERVLLAPTDERWVVADDPQSNLRLLRQGLPLARCLEPRQASQPEPSARRWAELLRAGLPHAAVLLGMGEDGHFASLFPGMPGLADALDLQQPPGALPGRAPDEPRQRLSLNLAMLCNTRWLGLLAFGTPKRELIGELLADTAVSREWPAYALFHQARVPLQVYWAP
jgi:6-phosphogluconolactonase